jgi:hypothetical protein
VTGRRAQTAALAGVVAVAALVWGALGQRLEVPTVFGDELIYWDASRSLADGDGLAVREGSYSFGPILPALYAPVDALAGDDLQAYSWARALNALLFALTAIPVFVLARRSLSPIWSLACAALAVCVPSALYTGFVMTESVGYLAATWAFLAIACVLERPSVRNQLLAIVVVGVAAGVRLQLAALGVVLVTALGTYWLLGPKPAAPRRDQLQRLWPLGAACLIAVGLGVLRIAQGEPLAGYDGLWQSYNPLDVLHWSWRALSGFGLYLALVPVVAAPAAAAVLAREGREGRSASRALLSLTAAASLVLVLVVGAFSSTKYGVGFLHDRYLFYLAPLWLIALATWADRRVGITRLQLAVGGVLVLALTATLPTYLLNKDGGRLFDAVATAIPGELAQRISQPEPPRWTLLLAAVVAVVLVGAIPRGARWLLPALVGSVFLVNGVLAWNVRTESARNTTFASMDPRTVSWVDAAVPRGRSVTMLLGDVSVEERDALRLTEFFNARIGRVLELGSGLAPTLSSDTVRLADDGRVVGSDAIPAKGAFVLTPKGLVVVDGRLIARGTVAGLQVWQTAGPLRVQDAIP